MKSRTPASPVVPTTDSQDVHRPRQQRSAATQDELLRATTRVLDTEGYDAATVPRIAAEAGLSPAALYRRFADKDDLLRAALLRVLEKSQSAEANQQRAQLVRPSLAETCEALVAALFADYRAHPLLLRALVRVVDAAPNTPFAQDVMRRIGDNLASSAAVLLTHKDKIRHPDPERAARFAVLSAATAIEGVALGEVSLWHTALPLSDKMLTVELTRQMVAYLRRKP